MESCPVADVLAAFASGRLDDADLAKVAAHLERCPRCLGALAVADPFTQSLQRIHQNGVSPWTPQSPIADIDRDSPYFFHVSDAPPTRDSETFFDCLAQSRLFEPDEMKAVRREWNGFRPRDIVAFAETLALDGRLTDFHVRQLLRGKWLGWVLDEYVVLHPLSAGGMERVFQAYSRRWKRMFAIKVTPQDGRLPAAAKRFHREIEAIAKLRHPRLIAAVDAGDSDGLDYLVMHELTGHSLAEWVELNGPMRILSAVDMIREAAEGIAAAHEAGVVHRDLKPSNLWIAVATESGHGLPGVRVLDFGTAQSSAVDASRSATDLAVGTPGYAAPELRRDSRLADERCDIYSLGCCLGFLLSGNSPPEEGSAPPALESPRDPVPESLQTIYRRMTAARPDQRYDCVDDLIVDLDAFLAGRRSDSRLRRNILIAIAAAVALALAATIALGLWP